MFRFVKFARLPLCRAGLKPVPVSRMISTSVPVRADAKASSDAASATADTTMRLARTQFDSNSYDHSWADHYVDPRTRADPTNRTFTYFVLGGGRFLFAATARVAVLQAISYLSPSADVLALSSLEVDIAKVLEGTSTTVMWRGKPVFIRHRNAREIACTRREMAHCHGHLHPFRLRTCGWVGRLRRVVLSLSRLSLRYFWAYSQRPRAA